MCIIEPENKFVNKSLDSLLSLRKKAQDVDIGEAPVAPVLQFEEYQLYFE